MPKTPNDAVNYCEHCGADASKAANFCRRCGALLRPEGSPSGPPRKLLIEQTSKAYKLPILLGAVAFCGGAILGLAAWGRGDETGALVGAVVAGFGFLTWAVAGVLAWWHHG